MKKVLFICALALSMIACKNDVNKVTSNPNNSSVTGTCVSAEAPSWKTVDNLTLSKMMVIVDADGVPTTMQDSDQLAAFVGESCRGVAMPFQDASGQWRINLMVHATSTDEDVNALVFNLRYYSRKEGGIYTSNDIAYEDDAILGNILAGYVPKWK